MSQEQTQIMREVQNGSSEQKAAATCVELERLVSFYDG